jgi:PKD domain-containing protein
LRPSIPALLSATIAAVSVGGVIATASTTGAGTAPGNGEQAFDAPGCEPIAYDGPGRAAHYLLDRDCATPTPVILVRSSYQRGAWRVTWDGSRSFDPVGNQLVSYAWSVGPGPQRIGPRISMRYTRPGVHTVELYVTDESGSTGAAIETVRVG